MLRWRSVQKNIIWVALERAGKLIQRARLIFSPSGSETSIAVWNKQIPYVRDSLTKLCEWQWSGLLPGVATDTNATF